MKKQKQIEAMARLDGRWRDDIPTFEVMADGLVCTRTTCKDRWEDCESSNGHICSLYNTRKTTRTIRMGELPTYDSLDAVKPVLKTLRLSELRKVANQLKVIIERDNRAPFIDGMELTAEAGQLTEAILKTKGLWVEG